MSDSRKVKRVYLDVCALSRPFDDQRYMRIRLETVAVDLILSEVKSQHLELVRSPVHLQEIEAIADIVERTELMLLLVRYGKAINVDKAAVRSRAEKLIGSGLGIADAVHVAFAEHAQAAFISCDDRLIKLCRRTVGAIWCGNPVAFCESEHII